MSATPWQGLLERAQGSDAEGLVAFARSLGPGESARALAHLDPEERRTILRALGPEEAADLIEMLTRAQAADVVEDLSPAYAADVLHELPTHTEADILRDLDDADAAAVLAELSPQEAAAVHALVGYPDETAGGLMVVEFVAVRAASTVSHGRGPPARTPSRRSTRWRCSCRSSRTCPGARTTRPWPCPSASSPSASPAPLTCCAPGGRSCPSGPQRIGARGPARRREGDRAPGPPSLDRPRDRHGPNPGVRLDSGG